MTPSEIIADLDAALRDAGETITVRRYTVPADTPRTTTDIDGVPAAVRALKAEELVGPINQTWSRVVLSPTLLAPLLPLVKGDKVVVQGRERNVEFMQPFAVQSVLVRIELLVSG